MAGCDIVEEIVEESLWKGSICMISDSICILAKDLEDVFVISEHKEQRLQSFESLSEVGLRFKVKYSLNLGVLPLRICFIEDGFLECFLLI